MGERYLEASGKDTPVKEYHKANYQRLLLQIYDFAHKHPNSGQLKRILSAFYKELELDPEHKSMDVSVSIVADLAYNNPSAYHLCAAILSKIIEYMDTEKKSSVISKIRDKFKKLPNTAFMDIWLQRISYTIDPDLKYSEKLCEFVQKSKSTDDTPNILWNSEWLPDEWEKEIEQCKLVDCDKLENMTPIISQQEVDVFKPQYDDFK